MTCLHCNTLVSLVKTVNVVFCSATGVSAGQSGVCGVASPGRDGGPLVHLPALPARPREQPQPRPHPRQVCTPPPPPGHENSLNPDHILARYSYPYKQLKVLRT